LPMRVNCFAIRSQRANIVCLRVSNMRPMVSEASVRSGFGFGRRAAPGVADAGYSSDGGG